MKNGCNIAPTTSNRQRAREAGIHVNGSRKDETALAEGCSRGEEATAKDRGLREKAGRLLEKFGLGSIQPGNQLPSREYRKLLDECDRSLGEFAQFLKIRPGKIALPDLTAMVERERRPMSIAFAARGKGGKGAAAAHCESAPINEDGIPSTIINLTRINGPGCLAHEWAHHFDNTLALAFRPLGKLGNITPYASCGDSIESMPANIAEAFRALIGVDREKRIGVIHKGDGAWQLPIWDPSQQIYFYQARESQFLCHARKLDGAKKKKSSRRAGHWEPYYQSPLELFARAFEVWVEDGLEALGRQDVFLVNGTRGSDRYPQGKERGLINKKFESLFAKLRQKGLLA